MFKFIRRILGASSFPNLKTKKNPSPPSVEGSNPQPNRPVKPKPPKGDGKPN